MIPGYAVAAVIYIRPGMDYVNPNIEVLVDPTRKLL